MGVEAVGSINNRYTVYKNPYMTSNDILVGFRGSNFLETGICSICTDDYDSLVYDPQTYST